jgi:hypothetical protein
LSHSPSQVLHQAKYLMRYGNVVANADIARFCGLIVLVTNRAVVRDPEVWSPSAALEATGAALQGPQARGSRAQARRQRPQARGSRAQARRPTATSAGLRGTSSCAQGPQARGSRAQARRPRATSACAGESHRYRPVQVSQSPQGAGTTFQVL